MSKNPSVNDSKGIVFFDLETTGLKTELCQIVQCTILLESGRCVYSKMYNVNFSLGLQKEQEIAAALAYNQLQPEVLATARLFGVEDLYDIARIFSGNSVVAYNVSYDSAVLKETSIRLLGEDIFSNTEYCCAMIPYAQSLGRKRTKLPNMMLGGLAHDSYSDTQNCRLVWQKLYPPVDAELSWGIS